MPLAAWICRDIADAGMLIVRPMAPRLGVASSPSSGKLRNDRFTSGSTGLSPQEFASSPAAAVAFDVFAIGDGGTGVVAIGVDVGVGEASVAGTGADNASVVDSAAGRDKGGGGGRGG